MSITGGLEDVGVPEVMQFVNLGSRTGTLYLEHSDGSTAEVSFYRGRIVSALGSRTTRLGDLLVQQGRVDQATVLRAIELQNKEGGIRLLGEVLVAMGAIARDDLRKSVELHIQDTIFQIFTWTRGSFHFALNEVKPIGGFETTPGEILPDVDLSTQAVLLEAARIFDQRNQTDQSPSTEEAPPFDLPATQDNPPPPSEPSASHNPPALSRESVLPWVHVVSRDDAFVDELKVSLDRAGLRFDRRGADTAGLRVPGEIAPMVVVDLGQEDALGLVEEVRRKRPEIAIIAAVSGNVDDTVYRVGAVAVAERDGETILACLRDVAETRREGASSLRIPAERLTPEKLQRLTHDLRSGVLSTSATLVLLKTLSESLDRAVLFLVNPEHLVAMGGFGSTTGLPKTSVVEATRGLRIPIDSSFAWSDTLTQRRSTLVSVEQRSLPKELLQSIGPPRNGEGAVFPVSSADRTILLVYADNGALFDPISDVALLDLAALQVGAAMENELLRKQLQSRTI